MTAHDAAIHDGRQSAISVVHLPLFKEPTLHRREVRIEISGCVLAYLPLDLLPKDDAISVFKRLPKLHQFEHVRARRATNLNTGLGEVTRERKVRVPNPF